MRAYARAARQRSRRLAARLALPRRAQPLHRRAAPAGAAAARGVRPDRVRRHATRSPRPSSASRCGASWRTSAGCPSSSARRCSMRELSGMSYDDLAVALDVTVPAIKSLLVRARIGLAQAAEARDTACIEIRESLADAHERGVRATGLARRHLQDCDGCRAYRGELRATHKRFAALLPGARPVARCSRSCSGSAAAAPAAAASVALRSAAARTAGGAVAGGRRRSGDRRRHDRRQRDALRRRRGGRCRQRGRRGRGAAHARRPSRADHAPLVAIGRRADGPTPLAPTSRGSPAAARWPVPRRQRRSS